MQNKNTGFSGTDQEYVYAGFWVRFAAYALDSLILIAGTLIIKFVFALISLISGITIFETEILFSFTLKDIIVYACHVIYFVLLTYYTGATFGKKAFNLKVIPYISSNSEDHANYERLTLINVIYRETVGRYLSGIFLYIGYLLAGLDHEKRAFHDILCDTRVIYAKKVKIYPEYQAPSMTGYPMSGIQPYNNPDGSVDICTNENNNKPNFDTYVYSGNRKSEQQNQEFDFDMDNRPHE